MIRQWVIPANENYKDWLRKNWWLVLIFIILFAVLPFLDSITYYIKATAIQPSECNLICDKMNLSYYGVNMDDCMCMDWTKCFTVGSYKYCKDNAIIIFSRFGK